MYFIDLTIVSTCVHIFLMMKIDKNFSYFVLSRKREILVKDVSYVKSKILHRLIEDAIFMYVHVRMVLLTILKHDVFISNGNRLKKRRQHRRIKLFMYSFSYILFDNLRKKKKIIQKKNK